jgi:hypothetical protein
VEVHCDDGVTEAERLEIDRWADTHDTNGIDTIVVGARIVAVHGISTMLGLAGTAVRRADVVAELDEALADMRKGRKVPQRDGAQAPSPVGGSA